jgi:hypothetical protein
VGVLNVLGRRAGKFVSFLWRLLPWALKIVCDVTKDVYNALFDSFRSWSPTARQKATEWRRKALESRTITQDYGTHIWWILYILAYVTFFAGWLLPPLLVVWLVLRLI